MPRPSVKTIGTGIVSRLSGLRSIPDIAGTIPKLDANSNETEGATIAEQSTSRALFTHSTRNGSGVTRIDPV
jgi:hypothetical protein